jgi:hypothetical protein
MAKSTKRASERIFYRKVENWRLFQLDWLWTPASLVFCVLMFFPLALIYQILQHS